jgi:hypothetical protein
MHNSSQSTVPTSLDEAPNPLYPPLPHSFSKHQNALYTHTQSEIIRPRRWRQHVPLKRRQHRQRQVAATKGQNQHQ